MESLIRIYRWLIENSRNLSQCGLLSFTPAKHYSFKNFIRNISMFYIRFSLKIYRCEDLFRIEHEVEGSSAKLLYIFHSFQDDIEKLELRNKVFLKLQQPKGI